MNFQQLRSVREAVRQGFNLTLAAQVLYTSQPGVSRQIRELEDELGVQIFERVGKRLIGLTPPGKLVLPIIERILLETDNLKRAGDEFAAATGGVLTIAATHSQARYVLPPAVQDFSARNPNVTVRMCQGSPKQVAELLRSGEADLGIATEALADYPDLVALPSYQWHHAIIVPHGHALVERAQKQGGRLALEDLSRFPIITYETGFTGRRHIDEAFSRKGIAINIVLSAMDADVIKTYVELGMGVGLIAGVAYDEKRDQALCALEAGHLFAPNMTRVAIRRGAFLRGYIYDFIQIFAPPLTRDHVDRAMQSVDLA